MVRKYVSNLTMSKLVSTLVSHSTQGDPRYDRSSTLCPWTWGKVCGIRIRSWRLATPRKTLENDDFTDFSQSRVADERENRRVDPGMSQYSDDVGAESFVDAYQDVAAIPQRCEFFELSQ